MPIPDTRSGDISRGRRCSAFASEGVGGGSERMCSLAATKSTMWSKTKGDSPPGVFAVAIALASTCPRWLPYTDPAPPGACTTSEPSGSAES